MKKVILVGGTGLIGQHLTEDLVKDGHQVTILTRDPEKYRDQFAAAVTLEMWDAQTVGPWIRVINGADVVVNLAGESIGGNNFLPDRWTDEKKESILNSRLKVAKVLVEAVEGVENKPALLLQASAIGYYGPRGDEVVTETTPPGSDFLASVVVDWENSTVMVEEFGVRRLLLRTGLILTTEGGPLPRMMLPTKLFVGGPYGTGKQWYPWIHMTDAIRAIRFLMDEKTFSGPVNLVSPNPVTNKAFAKSLGRAMNRPSIFPLPAFAMRIIAGEAAILVLEGQRAMPEVLQTHGFQFSYPELDAALADII